MYGNCPICGQRYGSDGTFKDGKLNQYKLCSHMAEKQKEFMEKQIKISSIWPGGRGSGKKTYPLFMKPLKEITMKTSVTKIITLETAHQLTDSYSHECQTIHGHSYKCEVTFEGEVDPETGMIIDFKKIKEILQPVHDKYDHHFFTKDTFNGINPTAENMAKDIFEMVRFGSTPQTLIKRVRLWETATCYAEVGY